jgi:hypothetical protein
MSDKGVIRRLLGKSGKKWLVPFWNIPQTLESGGDRMDIRRLISELEEAMSDATSSDTYIDDAIAFVVSDGNGTEVPIESIYFNKSDGKLEIELPLIDDVELLDLR